MDYLFYLLLLVFLAAAGYVGWMFLKGYLTGQSPTAAIFGPRPEKRLEVVEQSNVDGRRRLVLIRRDDVEHLIMTGGPVDMVIETGIKRRRHLEPPLEDVIIARSDTRPAPEFEKSQA